MSPMVKSPTPASRKLIIKDLTVRMYIRKFVRYISYLTGCLQLLTALVLCIKLTLAPRRQDKWTKLPVEVASPLRSD